DQTDAIVNAWSQRDPRVCLRRFTERTGKPQIINTLVKENEGDILILSDADTLFIRSTLVELVKPFAHNEVGGVQARFRSKAAGKFDVAQQELKYNDRERLIKKGQCVDRVVIAIHGGC